MTTAANDSMLQIAINAAAAGHDLTGFQPVQDEDDNPNGYEARCRLCSMTAWVDDSGMMYSLLADTCPNGEGMMSTIVDK